MGKYVFIIAIVVSLITDSQLSGHQWYSQEVIFSDWRGIPPVDYSTNAPVSTWYSGHPARYLRAESVKRFVEEPDTVTLGIDYYGLTEVSGKLAESFHAQWVLDSLRNGGVLVAKSFHGTLYLIEP